MDKESMTEFYDKHLEDLRRAIGDDLGLADKVDDVYAEALNMSVGDVREFETAHSTLRVELTMDGFQTKLFPKKAV